MKTKLIVLLIALITFSTLSYSQTTVGYVKASNFNKLTLSGSVKLGYSQARTIIYPNADMIKAGFFPYFDLNSPYGKIKVNANYKGFCAYISNKTYFLKDGWKSLDFNPVQIEFITGATYTLKRFSLNWEHLCSHSIEGRVFTQYYDDFGIEVKF